MSDIEKIKQHYLPKAYLSFFATQGRTTPMIYAYFLATRESKYLSIDRICFQNYLYEHKIKSENSTTLNYFHPNEIENSFIEYEGKYSSLVKRIVNDIETTDTYILTDDDHDTLTLSLALFQFRSPSFVNISNYITEKILFEKTDLIKMLKVEYPDIDEQVIKAVIAHENLYLAIHPQKGIYVDSLKNVVKDDQLCILRSNTCAFITSDAPIINIWGCRDNVDYDILGMPITPNLFLAFIDSQKKLDPVIDINESDVQKLNMKQRNRKAPSMFLSQDDVLSAESCEQTIENIELTAGMELFEGMVLDEESLALYHDMMKSFEK